MKPFLLFVACCCIINSFAQVPFSTFRKPVLDSHESDQRTYGLSAENKRKRIYQLKLQELDTISNADYFNHVSANIVVLQNAKKMFPTINGEVINYRLGLWTEKKYSDTDLNKLYPEPRIHYLPFSIISKISGNYFDSAAGTTNDASSFLGAPLTFRLSPCIDLTPKLIYNKLFFGVNADLRLLIIGDTEKDKLESSWGSYFSAGFTYMGTGYAFKEDTDKENKKRYNGKWSISTMIYGFKGGGSFNKAVFGEDQKKTLTGIEILLRFKTNKKEDSKFNFLIGAGNGFTRGAPNYARWDFRIGIGS